MYYYLVDPKPYNGKNFEFFQTRLLSLLGEYHIAGETARATKLRTVEDLVGTAISHGATTLVVVGGDETFSRVVSVAHGKPITLGYIPVSTGGELGMILGVRTLEEGVATIAKRLVAVLDLGKIGPSYFVSSLHFGAREMEGDIEETDKSTKSKSWWKLMLKSSAVEVGLSFDGSFKATDNLIGGMIINTRCRTLCKGNKSENLGNPCDGRLDVVIASKLGRVAEWRNRKLIESRCYESLPGSSVIHAKKVEIFAPVGMPIYLYDHVIAHAPVTVEMAADKVRVIVGRERQF